MCFEAFRTAALYLFFHFQKKNGYDIPRYLFTLFGVIIKVHDYLIRNRYDFVT